MLVLLDVVGLIVLGWMLLRRSDGGACDDVASERCPLDIALESLSPGARYGAPSGNVRVYIFLDIWSDAARQVFRELTFAITSESLPQTELVFVQSPSVHCGAAATSLPCLAALSTECSERLVPGSGVGVMGDLFDARWRPITPEDISRLARSRVARMSRGGEFVLPSALGGGMQPAVSVVVALAGQAAQMVERSSALDRCVRTDVALREQLARNQVIAGRLGVRDGVGGVVAWRGEPRRYASFGAWIGPSSLRRLSACVAGGCEEEP